MSTFIHALNKHLLRQVQGDTSWCPNRRDPQLQTPSQFLRNMGK